MHRGIRMVTIFFDGESLAVICFLLGNVTKVKYFLKSSSRKYPQRLGKEVRHIRSFSTRKDDYVNTARCNFDNSQSFAPMGVDRGWNTPPKYNLFGMYGWMFEELVTPE